jgi:TolB-like protein/tRNA A-37 threonylcarbamoyl transferase component Bud32
VDLTGRTLSHYRLGNEISRGGMGVVYRATDTRLQREVALKVLPDELMDDPDRRRRFLQEAQAASAIEHPNVAVIYDADEADGHTFIAMELIRGQKLSDWLATAHPPVGKMLEVATQIASGLARAHEKQIVHRDLKPANVMVTADGDAKIIDFGIAKLMETAPSAAAETRVQQDTGVGVVLGTMTYMSPEQARGDRVDHRSDIFSFGTVLHEMLTGQVPFQGRSGLETAAAILHTPAPRLSSLGPGVVGELTADLQRVLDKCLAKDPADRYQGMKDLVVDLRAIRRRLESGTQPATVVAAVAPGSATRSRLRIGWGLGALGVLAVVGGAAWLWRLWVPRPPAPGPGSTKPSVAVLYFDNSTAAPDLDWLRTGITEMVVTDLSQSTHLEVVSSDRLYSALAALKRTDDKVLSPDVVNQVADRTGVDHVVVGSYMKSGDAIRINVRLQDVKTGRIVTSESIEGPSTSSLFQMVDDLSHRLLAKFEGLAPKNAAATPLIAAPGEGFDRGLGQVTTSSIDAYRAYSEGINQHERFREADAATLFERALAIDPSFAMAQAKLAVAEENLGRLDLRDRYARQALDHAERLTPRERYYIEGFTILMRRRPSHARSTPTANASRSTPATKPVGRTSPSSSASWNSTIRARPKARSSSAEAPPTPRPISTSRRPTSRWARSIGP